MLSATALAMVLVVAVFVFVLVVVQICAHKRKAIVSNSAQIELTKMEELTMETMGSTQAFNMYSFPIHNCYCNEEKVAVI